MERTPMEWLTPAALLALVTWWRISRGRWRLRAIERGEETVEVIPFCEVKYAENKAGSLDWELQQALRRAATLEKKGKTAEAVAILTAVRDKVSDPNARAVLDQEIARLSGVQPPAEPGRR